MRHLVRLCFAKADATLDAALDRLAAVAAAGGVMGAAFHAAIACGRRASRGHIPTA